MKAIGARSQYVTLAEPTTTRNTDGGFDEVPAPLDPPAVMASVEPADQRSLERVAMGTVVSTASHIVTMPYHPGVTTKTVITVEGRTLKVISVRDPKWAHRETIAVCVEQVA